MYTLKKPHFLILPYKMKSFMDDPKEEHQSKKVKSSAVMSTRRACGQRRAGHLSPLLARFLTLASYLITVRARKP